MYIRNINTFYQLISGSYLMDRCVLRVTVICVWLIKNILIQSAINQHSLSAEWHYIQYKNQNNNWVTLTSTCLLFLSAASDHRIGASDSRSLYLQRKRLQLLCLWSREQSLHGQISHCMYYSISNIRGNMIPSHDPRHV